MIERVYIPNGIAILLLAVIVFTLVLSRRKLLTDAKIFICMMGCNVYQCVTEILCYTIDGGPRFRGLNILLNATLFIGNILFSYLWVIYADYKIFEDFKRIRRRGRLLAIPALLVILGALINLFTPVFFSVSADNVYQRSGLFFLPYLATYFYLIYGTVFIYRHKSQARKYISMPALMFMVPIFLGSLLQFFFYGYSLVWAGTAIALVQVYVNLQAETSSTDALSGLYNRTYLYQYLERLLQRGKNLKLAGIMLDVDNFKQINDRFGHVTGDHAIRTAGKILLNETDNDCICARYGGDEFVILTQGKGEAGILNLIENLDLAEDRFNAANTRGYTLRFSKGFTFFDPERDSIESFLDRMDAAMYEIKNQRKQNKRL